MRKLSISKWVVLAEVVAGSVLLEICMMPLRGYDLIASGVAALALCGVYALICLSKITKVAPPYFIVLAIALGFLIIHLPIRIVYWRDTLITFPDAVMHFLGIGLGYLFWHSQKILSRIGIAILSVCISTAYVYGFDLHLNKLSFGTWTGELKNEITIGNPPILNSDKGDSITINDFEKDYLIFDLWTTSCGGCFKAFPDVQTLYDKYKDSPQVGVLSVHCRMEDRGETIATGTTILSENGYTLANLSMDINDPILKELNIWGFPTVLIFNSERELVFHGNIDFAARFISRELARK